MTKGWVAIGGACAYVIALVALAPAAIVDAALAGVSGGQARIGEPRGSVWAGSGQLQLRDAKDRVLAVEELEWRIRPAALIAARILADVRVGRETSAFEVALSPAGISVTNADVRLPAAALAMIPKLAPLELTGDLLIRVNRLLVDRKSGAGSASMTWRSAGSALAPIHPLGDYVLELDAPSSSVRAVLRTINGPLVLDGAGTWAPGERPRFLATARVANDKEAELAPLLRLIAVETGKGIFELQLQ